MANEVIRGMGFHHIALYASNFEKSLKFYLALGMKPLVEWGEGKGRIMLLDVGNGDRLELFAKGGDEYSADGKWNHFALEVEDVEKAYEIALKAGAEPHIAPKTVALNSFPVKITIQCGFVKGPDGEQVEFFRQVEGEPQ